MSKIGKVLGEEEFFEKEDTFTEEQEDFFKEEGFTWNEYTGWNYNGSKNNYNIWIDANVHYFSLYIYQGEYQGESEFEETFYWYSQSEFEREYDNMLEKIEEFFKGANE